MRLNKNKKDNKLTPTQSSKINLNINLPTFSNPKMIFNTHESNKSNNIHLKNISHGTHLKSIDKLFTLISNPFKLSPIVI